MSRRREPGNARGWHTLDNFHHIHDRRLDDYQREGFVLDHNLSFRRLGDGKLLLQGRIWCAGNLFIDVETHLIVRSVKGRRQVRIDKYAFHAGVGGVHNRSLFRYDNFHAYSREGIRTPITSTSSISRRGGSEPLRSGLAPMPRLI